MWSKRWGFSDYKNELIKTDNQKQRAKECKGRLLRHINMQEIPRKKYSQHSEEGKVSELRKGKGKGKV